MAKRNGPGIRCVNCGCHLDPGKRCDCERVEAERRAAEKAANTRRIVEHKLRVMEQAQLEFYYS